MSEKCESCQHEKYNRNPRYAPCVNCSEHPEYKGATSQYEERDAK